MRANLLRPTPSACHAQASSSGTGDSEAVTAAPLAQGALITVETNGCYVTVDGSVPSASNGLLLPTGVLHFLPLLGSSFHFASSVAGTSKLNILWVM